MMDYVTLLKENNLKATFQRISILKEIDINGHMSVESIYKEVVKGNPSISLATIYKNIILMVESSVLVEVPIAGQKPKYELSKMDHIHLVCTECGDVEDKTCLPESDKIFNELSFKEHFKLNKRQVNLYGVCANCQDELASA
jgi:Fe2+ or Zn2+ uptake regulation protein